MRCAYNSLYRQIFGYKQFESVTNLQISIGRPTWEMQIETQKAKFFERLATCKADSPVHVFSLIAWISLKTRISLLCKLFMNCIYIVLYLLATQLLP